jgi:arylsulfatase A-like enzyme
MPPNAESEELYDLQNDRWQERNLAGDPAHAEKLEELRVELERLREDAR